MSVMTRTMAIATMTTTDMTYLLRSLVTTTEIRLSMSMSSLAPEGALARKEDTHTQDYCTCGSLRTVRLQAAAAALVGWKYSSNFASDPAIFKQSRITSVM